MAVSATSLSTLSSLSIRTSPRFSLLHQSPFLSTTFLAPNFQSLSLSNSSKTPKLNPLKCQAEDEEEEEREAPIKAIETIYYENDDPQGISTFDPPEMPDDFVEPPSFDDGPMEDEDQIAAAYEELYGPAYSGISVLGNDIYEMDSRVKKKSALGIVKKEKVRDGFDERVVQVRRVTKVVKGGKQMNFRAVVVVGDKKGQVGVGVGKATEVIEAVQKSAADARRNIITVPLTKYSTFPHRADGKYGAAKVMLRPASPGSGVLAGGSVKIVLDMAGVENALGKQLGSNNALNNARATIVAVSQMRQFSEVAQDRGIPMEELWK